MSARKKRAWLLENNKRWKALSRSYLGANILCVRCKLLNRDVAATEVDHILPLRTHPNLAFETSNLQAMCKSCHAIKGGYERKGLCYDYVRGIIYSDGS